jgi:hypothetical protein
MMRILILFLGWFAAGCRKESEPQPYVLNTIVMATATPSQPCVKTGKVTITAPVGSGYNYQFDGGAFQSSNLFENVAVGLHKITVKNSRGCTAVDTIVVDTVTAGNQFNSVKAVLATYCTPCHFGVNPQAGHDWSDACTIIQQWDRIKARAVDGNPGPMPPAGLIPASQRTIIANWINGGHGYQH